MQKNFQGNNENGQSRSFVENKEPAVAADKREGTTREELSKSLAELCSFVEVVS